MDIKNYSTKIFVNSDCMNSYFSDIRKFKVMTNEEEKQAFENYANGDISARERILNSNQRFVFALAKRYAKDEDEVLDYVSEGNIGLITAFDSFDVTKGYKFITFAVWYIQRSMNYYLTVTNNLVKRSNSMKIGKKADRIREKITAERGFAPDDKEVIKLLEKIYGLKVKDISDISEINVTSISDEVTDDFSVEDDSEFTKATASTNLFNNEIESEAQSELVEKILSELPENFSIIIKMLFGIGYDHAYSEDDVAYKMEMYPEDIVKIKNNVLAYLKDKNKLKRAVC